MAGAKRQQKKRGCVASCLVGLRNFVMVVTIIFSVILAAGYFVGDYYAKKYLDMSAPEILGVVNGVMTSNPNNIVNDNEKYSDSDLTSFYSGIKSKLFLADGYDLQDLVEGILDSFVDQATGTELSNAEQGEESTTEDEGEKNEIMDKILAEILNANNFDFQTLRGFDYDNPSDFTDYTLTDKQLAAFLNSILTSDALNDILAKMVQDRLQMDIPFSVGIKKAVLFVETDSYRVNTAAEGETPVYITETGDVTKMKMTVSIGFRETIKALLKQLPSLIPGGDFSWLGNFSFLGNMLPQELYFTAEAALDKDAMPRIYLNNMDNKKMTDLYKLVSSISKLAGVDFELESIVQDTGSTMIFPMVAQLGNALNFSQAEDGKIIMSPFDLLLGLMFDGADGATKVEGKDLFMLLKSMIIVDPTQIITNGYVADDEKQNLIDEINAKYFVTLNDIDEFLDMLTGGGEGDSGDMLDKITNNFSPENLRDAYKDDTLTDDDLKVQISDKMLAAMVSNLMENMGSDSTSGSSDDQSFSFDAFGIDQIILSDDQGQKQIMQLTASLDLKTLLDSVLNDQDDDDSQDDQNQTNDSDMQSLLIKFVFDLIDIGQLPEKIYLSLYLDITDSSDPSYQRASTYFEFNSLNANDTEKMVSILSTLIGQDFDSYIQEIDQMVMPMIDQMRSVMPVKFQQSQMELPGIFELIVTLMNIEIQATDEATGDLLFDDTTGDPITRPLTADELRTILRALDKGTDIDKELDDDYTPDGNEYLDNMPDADADELNEFFKLMEEKYYLQRGTLSYDDNANAAYLWYLIEEGEYSEGDKPTEQELRQNLLANLTALAAVEGIYEATNETEFDEFIAQKMDEIFADYIDTMKGSDDSGEQTGIDKITGGTLFSSFDTTSFRKDAEETTSLQFWQTEYAGLFDDNSSIDDLSLVMSDKALAAIVKDMLDIDASNSLNMAQIMQISVKDAGADGMIIEIILRAELSALLGDSEEMLKFLPADALSVLYIKSISYLDVPQSDNEAGGNTSYKTEITINSADDDEMKLIYAMLDSLGGMGSTIKDLETTVGKAVYDAFTKLESTLGFEYVDGGIKFQNFYEFLSQMMGLDFEEYYFGNAVDTELADLYAYYKAEYFREQNKSVDPSLSNEDPDFVAYLKTRFYATLKDMLQGLDVTPKYNEIVIHAISNKELNDINIEASDIMIVNGTSGLPESGYYDADPDFMFDFVITGTNADLTKIKISDNFFGGYLKNDGGANNADVSTIGSGATIVQTMLVSLEGEDRANATTGTLLEKLFDFFDTHIAGRTDSVDGKVYGQKYDGAGNLDESGTEKLGDFLVFTVELDISSMSFDGASGLFPDKILISAIINLDITRTGDPGDEEYSSDSFIVINGYTKEQQDMFFYMIGNVSSGGNSNLTEQALTEILCQDIIYKELYGCDFEINSAWTDDGDPMGYIVYTQGNMPVALKAKAAGSISINP